MTPYLIVLALVACSRTPTPEQACNNIEARCGTLAGLAAKDVVDCANDLPKVQSTLGDAEYTKFLRGKTLDCFGGAGKVLGDKLTHNVLDDLKK